MPDIQVDERLIRFLFFLPFFFVSLAVHEFAHAWTAYRYGDTTAKDQGRLTLNPLKHIDIIGSIVMPVLAFTSGFALIGWAKPVPVNPGNFQRRFRDDAVVSFAGPLSNFILALLFLAGIMIIQAVDAAGGIIGSILWYGVYLNIFLFTFNLLPIPPLDGSHILYDLFPNKVTASYVRLGLYGSILLLVFIYTPLWDYFMMLLGQIFSVFQFFAGV